MGGAGNRHPSAERRAKEWRYQGISEVTASRRAAPRSVKSVQCHGGDCAKVKVNPREQRRPYSSYEKFSTMKVEERPPNPYFTPWEKYIESEIESRKKWVGGTFIVTDHKAVVSRRERATGTSCVAAGGPYKNPSATFREENRSKFIGPRGFIS
jgi:hypothetical protein